MKTNMIAFSILALLVSTTVHAEPPTVVVKRAIAVNGSTNASTFDNPTQSTVVVGQSGCSNINGFQAAMQFEFMVDDEPVNVQNFKVTSAVWKLVSHNGTIWSGTTFGAYHAIGTGSPDYLIYKADGSDITPTTANQWVTNWGGNNWGIVTPLVSKFQIVNHPVPTTLSVAGNYYTLWYEMSFSYSYDGQPYTKTLVATDTALELLVTNDLPDFVNEPGSPSLIELFLSDDLVTWVPAPVSVPNPRPDTVTNIINLVPSTTNVDELVNDRRFYRYRQMTLPGYP